MMKLILILLFLVSCQSRTEESNSTEKSDTFSVHVVDTASTVQNDSFNFTDKAGLKQGKWEKHLRDRLWEAENYKGNVLHGKSYEYLSGGELIATDYLNGVRHGYTLHYNPDSSFGRFVTYWENGKKVWSAFPWELESYIVPIKDFLVERDTVDITVPYNSGKIMYQGRVVSMAGGQSKAIGLHQAFYETGELKATVDYNKDWIRIYTKDGKLLVSTKVEDWRGRRME